MLKIHKIIQRKSAGQGMVEFALVIPLLLVVVVGMIEFGFFFFVYSSINSATREAVRFGSASGPSAIGVPYFQYCQGIRDTARRVGAFSGMEDAEIQIGYDTGPGTTQDWTQCLAETQSSNWAPESGDRILVRITVPYNPISSMLGVPPINITAKSARTILLNLEVNGTPLPTTTVMVEDTPLPGSTAAMQTTVAALNLPTGTSTSTPEASTPCPGGVCSTPVVCLTPIELGGCE